MCVVMLWRSLLLPLRWCTLCPFHRPSHLAEPCVESRQELFLLVFDVRSELGFSMCKLFLRSHCRACGGLRCCWRIRGWCGDVGGCDG